MKAKRGILAILSPEREVVATQVNDIDAGDCLCARGELAEPRGTDAAAPVGR
jgi:hypothetical protein